MMVVTFLPSMQIIQCLSPFVLSTLLQLRITLQFKMVCLVSWLGVTVATALMEVKY